MSQQALPPSNTARLALTTLCKVLRHYGIISLEPELARQAKFDGLAAGPLWRVLHDLVLVVLADCPSGPACQAALSRQWHQLSLELPEDAEFPYEGAVLVLRQLALWGAPQSLIQELSSPPPPAPQSIGGRGPLDPDPLDNLDPDLPRNATGSGSGSWPRSCRSRPLLLALGWLVAAGGLFERRIAELEPGPGLRALLPPYPQDSCVSPAVQAAYDSAAVEAQEYVRKLPAGGFVASGADEGAAAAGGRSNAGLRGRGGGGGGGATATDPFGSSHGATAAATATAGGGGGGEALWREVEVAAQRAVMLCGRVRSRLVALQAATDCRSRLAHSLWSRQAAAAAPSTRPLTPYELQLCSQPGMMQHHMAALEAATLALLEQQELAAHGALFFEWLGSVIEEERQHQHQQRKVQQGRATGRLGGVGGGHAGRTPPGGGGQGPGSGGALASLEHLPYFSSDAGTRLAAHLEAQLEAAVQAAEPEIAAARRRAEDLLTRPAGGAVTVVAAAKAGALAAGGGCSRQPQQQQQSSGVTMEHFLALAEQAVSELRPPVAGGWRGDGVDAAVSGDGGPSGSTTKLCATTEAGSGVWRLPDDLAAALDSLHIAEHRRRCADEEEEAQFQQLRYAALARYDFPGAAAVSSVQGLSPAAADTQRLLGVVLATARPLARTRAAHKAALMAALQDLPEGYVVAGL